MSLFWHYRVVRSLSLLFPQVNKNQQFYTQSIADPTQVEIEKLTSFLETKKKCLVITGAGCSTESGIPDYRGPNGSYKKGHKPMMYNDFISSEHSRKRYWARSVLGWSSFTSAQPNDVHYSLAKLEVQGIVKAVVTQNVDRLHQKGGSKLVFDLHGRNDRVGCLSCGYEMSRRIVQDQLNLMNPDFIVTMRQQMRMMNKRISSENNNERGSNSTSIENGINIQQRADGDMAIDIEDFNDFKICVCPKCNGVLKPTVVYFGDNVPLDKVAQISQLVEECDGVLILGTSLEVFSAYRFVDKASKLGKPLAIVNNGETRAERSQLSGIVYKSDALCSKLLHATTKQLLK